jgi:hypothetical protein
MMDIEKPEKTHNAEENYIISLGRMLLSAITNLPYQEMS